MYERVRQRGEQFAVLFVSGDREPGQFQVCSMPWRPQLPTPSSL